MLQHPHNRQQTRADTQNVSSADHGLSRVEELAHAAPAAMTLVPDRKKMLWPAQITILALVVVTLVWWKYLIDIGVALVRRLQ
jgi:hypothetical protein